MPNHRVTFEKHEVLSRLISEAEIRDLIDVLYKGEAGTFRIIGEKPPKKKSTLRGLCQSMWSNHTIWLNVPAIVRTVKKYPMGGNYPAPTARMGAAMVLAHEIQHANQAVDVHSHRDGVKPFQRYLDRAEEVDARRSVDENITVIAGVLGEPVPQWGIRRDAKVVPGPDLVKVASDLEGCSELTLADVAEELRQIKANNSRNVEVLVGLLKEKGVAIRG